MDTHPVMHEDRQRPPEPVSPLAPGETFPPAIWEPQRGISIATSTIPSSVADGC